MEGRSPAFPPEAKAQDNEEVGYANLIGMYGLDYFLHLFQICRRQAQ